LPKPGDIGKYFHRPRQAHLLTNTHVQAFNRDWRLPKGPF
jgi:hypothetical protein